MLSRLANVILPRFNVEREKVKVVARLLSHVEHSGGVLVGIEFVFPHVLAASQLVVTFFAVFILHIVAGGDYDV